MADWQRVRSLQRADPFGGVVDAPPTDDLPMNQWQLARDRQVRGLTATQVSGPRARQVAFAAPRAAAKATPVPVAKGPLTGRPGTAAIVVGAINAIASGPNQSQAIDLKDFKGQVSRGAGRDVRADGTVPGISLQVGASGVLEPATGRAEVSVSGVKGRGIGLPHRIRIYTTPSGELNFDLPGPIKLGPIPIRPKSTYVIGTPDAPKGRR